MISVDASDSGGVIVTAIARHPPPPILANLLVGRGGDEYELEVKFLPEVLQAFAFGGSVDCDLLELRNFVHALRRAFLGCSTERWVLTPCNQQPTKQKRTKRFRG